MGMFLMLHCSIHINEKLPQWCGKLPDMDELLVPSFHPDISDDEEKVEGQENADSLGLEPRSFESFLLGANGEDSESDSEAVTIRI